MVELFLSFFSVVWNRTVKLRNSYFGKRLDFATIQKFVTSRSHHQGNALDQQLQSEYYSKIWITVVYVLYILRLFKIKMYCNDETQRNELNIDSNDLIVRSTTLKRCNFEGLFANRVFKKDEIICIYRGTVLRTKEALNLSDKSYLMRLGEQCYVDAKDHLDTLAR